VLGEAFFKKAAGDVVFLKKGDIRNRPVFYQYTVFSAAEQGPGR